MDALQRLLLPAVATAGFVFAGASPAGEDPEVNIRLLEYHAGIGRGRRVLGFYDNVDERVVVGELWSPEDLQRAAPPLTAEEIATWSRTWRYDPETDPDALAREIGAELIAHLEEPTSGR